MTKIFSLRIAALLTLCLVGLPQLAQAQQTLTIAPQPTQGFVIDRDGNINCGVTAACDHDYTNGTAVTLTARATDPAYHFLGWSGDCSGTAASITVTMDRAKTCRPHFLRAAYTQISISASYQCALLKTSTIHCWGAGSDGQLGNGQNSDASAPVNVQGISTAIVVNVSGRDTAEAHSCAVLADGTVWCWGDNGEGQLGNNTRTDSNIPVKAQGLSGVTSIALGNESTCAVAHKKVFCWGDNVSAQLGLGDTTRRLFPTTLSTITNASAVNTGRSHTCAIDNGVIKCWGSNSDGRLGVGKVFADLGGALTPQTIAGGLSTAIAISVGLNHSCAVLADSTAWCWGVGRYGKLGTGNTANILMPTKVLDISTAIAIAAGNNASCALLRSGSIQCWGRNHVGQLGAITGDTATPVNVQNISTAIRLGLSFRSNSDVQRSCATLANGTARCWGSGVGTTPSTVPGGTFGLSAPTATVAAFFGFPLIITSPYRAIGTTVGSKPSWLGYSASAEAFLGTVPVGSTVVQNIMLSRNGDVPITLSPTAAISLNLRSLPTRITIEDASPTRNAVSTGLAGGAVIGTVRLVAKDPTGNIPVVWSIADNENFLIDARSGAIVTKKNFSATSNGHSITVTASFPSPAQLIFQPDLGGITGTHSFSIAVTAANNTPLKLHVKTFLEGPLQ